MYVFIYMLSPGNLLATNYKIAGHSAYAMVPLYYFPHRFSVLSFRYRHLLAIAYLTAYFLKIKVGNDQ